jgi:mannose-1-phosphate guanylyltransferase/mannose-6-phosphate isomerase
MSLIHPVILCGGSGTRLWPVSRKAYPKQFAPLVGPESLYQMTLRRFARRAMPRLW